MEPSVAVLQRYQELGNTKLKYPPQIVERALYELAALGGSTTRASAKLLSEGVHMPDHPDKAIPPRTLSEWKNRIFRNRYQQILTEQARDLEETVAAQGIEHAIRIGEAEQKALKQTLAGLSLASGVEASTILRNLAQAKDLAVKDAALLRGRPTQIVQNDSLEAIAAELRGFGLMVGAGGAGSESEPIQEAEVVDDPPAEPRALPPGLPASAAHGVGE